MDKNGASKGYVLVISLDDDPTSLLTNDSNEILIFDRFDEIYTYCNDSNINIDEILVNEIRVDDGEVVTNLGNIFEFPEVTND